VADVEREARRIRECCQAARNKATATLNRPGRGWLKAEWRGLVSATSFCEWTDIRPKVTHWFALDESRPLFGFARIWRFWTGERKGETGEHQLFAFLTTE
jgi:putative SOS response-associated peptidase YedK